MEKFEKVKALIALAEVDAEKFYSKGNSAAGTRLRKVMQDLKVAAQEVRNSVTEQKNTK
jgi:signal transduction histidine kinase